MRFVDKLRRPALGLVLILAMTGCGESGNAGDREPGGTESVKTESGTPESDEAEDGMAENGLAKSDEAEDGPAESGMQQDTETESSETEGSEVKREIVTIQDKAYESFSSFIDAYYFKSRITEGVGSFIGSNIFFWEPAEMYEMVIDAYEHTGDERYYRMIREIFEGFKLEHGEDWAWNEYNDDIAWMTIACTRAYN